MKKEKTTTSTSKIYFEPDATLKGIGREYKFIGAFFLFIGLLSLIVVLGFLVFDWSLLYDDVGSCKSLCGLSLLVSLMFGDKVAEWFVFAFLFPFTLLIYFGYKAIKDD